jgi:hypothetical protein
MPLQPLFVPLVRRRRQTDVTRGLVNEVGEGEIILGLGEVAQHPEHLLSPPRGRRRAPSAANAGLIPSTHNLPASGKEADRYGPACSMALVREVETV